MGDEEFLLARTKDSIGYEGTIVVPRDIDPDLLEEIYEYIKEMKHDIDLRFETLEEKIGSREHMDQLPAPGIGQQAISEIPEVCDTPDEPQKPTKSDFIEFQRLESLRNDTIKNLPSKRDFRDFKKYQRCRSKRTSKMAGSEKPDINRMPSSTQLDMDGFLKLKQDVLNKGHDRKLTTADCKKMIEHRKKNVLVDDLWSDNDSKSGSDTCSRSSSMNSMSSEESVMPYVKQNILIPGLWSGESSPCESPRESPAEIVDVQGLWSPRESPEEIVDIPKVATDILNRKSQQRKVLMDQLWDDSSTEDNKPRRDDVTWTFMAGAATGGLICWFLSD